MTFIGGTNLTPVTGMMNFDKTTGQMNIYDGSKWRPVSMGYTGHTGMDKKLVVEELTFGGITFYTMEPVGYDWDEIYIWVRETFGQPRTDRGGFEKKWFISGGTFWFDDQKHRDWAVLRWTGNADN